jgi:DNA-binding transcriptional regulator GbsR (MarR family)
MYVGMTNPSLVPERFASKSRLEYYEWQNRLFDTFQTKDILKFVPIEKKKD